MPSFGDIVSGIQNIVSFIAVLGGGVVLVYFVLPHIGKTLQSNMLTLAWILLMVGISEYFLMFSVFPCIQALVQYFGRMYYFSIPSAAASGLWQFFLLVFSIWLVKIGLFPEHHHAAMHKSQHK